ncbi:M48 family metalloprotease [Desertibaculum subflavum]|uniref:M48 family metalloprotease n=1 Tax=Desertibaculum subflavum TaxID=2268458 RepID=UPI000E6650FA
MNLLPRLAFLAALAGGIAAPAVVHAQIFMSPEEEKRLGTEEHPKILREFGGVYDDPQVAGYVAVVGGRLAANSDNPEIGYTITLLNSPVVNAFALPGGYVYITRGLMALANDEAELAGVLGHEIGHVTARHTAKRQGKSTVAGGLITLGALATGILTGSSGLAQGVQQLGSVAAAGYLASFSREQEYEADLIGVKVLARTGYSPNAQAEFLQSLADHSALEGKLAGQKGEQKGTDWLATHPNTRERVQRAINAAGLENARPDAPINREQYLKTIDGMIYGDDPAQGFVRGQTFSHPQLRITFTVPQGFRLVNTDAAVVAVQRQGGSRIQFDSEPDKRKAATDPASYITRVWVPKLGLKRTEQINVNGLPAATAAARVNTQNGQVDVRFVAIQWDQSTMFRFLFITPPQQTSAMTTPFQQTTYSFRRLTDQEIAGLKPHRIRIHTVRAGDTVESLAAGVPGEELPAERLRVLNGMQPNDQLRAGQKIKLVVEQ